MKIEYNKSTFSHTVIFTDEELISGGIARLIKALADVGAEHGNLPTYDSTRCDIGECGIMTNEEHCDEYLPEKYAYVY